MRKSQKKWGNVLFYMTKFIKDKERQVFPLFRKVSQTFKAEKHKKIFHTLWFVHRYSSFLKEFKDHEKQIT